MKNTIDFEKSVIIPNNNNSVYANGIYVSENNNKLDKLHTLENKIFLERFIGQNNNNLNLTDAYNILPDKLQLVNTFTISMWIFPIINEIRLYPMCILSKDNNDTHGETNLQISVDNRLCYFYQYGNKVCIIKSKNKIVSNTFTFIIISKTAESVSIYINDKLDTVYPIINVPTFTITPLIIGTGKNTVFYKGLIENLTISDEPIADIQKYLNIYYKYPSIYIFKIDGGKLIYSNYNSFNNNTGIKLIEQSKNIVTILSQHLNGFTYNTKYNIVLFYISILNNMDAPVGDTNIENYQKINILHVGGDQVFVQQSITYPEIDNVVVEEPIEAQGFMRSNNGVIQMFDNGNVIQYHSNIAKYEYIDINELEALHILNEFPQIIGYIESDKYIFYVSYNQITQHNEFINRFRLKMLSYNFGSINSNINFINNRSVNIIGSKSDKSIINKKSKFDSKFDEKFKKIEIIEKLPNTNNDEILNLLNSNLFIYNTKKRNITSALNKCLDKKIDVIPELINRYNIDFEFNTTVDLIDNLLNRQIDLDNQVIFNYNKPISPNMYNFSIVSNSYINVKINGKEYVINSPKPIHILFHNSKILLELEISFYYENISQIARFMISEP